MTMKEEENRLRPPAAERLAADEECFDLPVLAEELREEDHSAVRGHRQMTIFKKGPVTMVLFAFDADSELKEHAANGIVTIQCVAGSLMVGTAQDEYELHAGQVVALAPKIRHNVKALKRSTMLLTVHRA